MKAIMITVRLWWFYLTYKDIKKAEIRKRFAKDFKGKIFECVSKTNWKKDLMKIPAEEREFFKQFVGKVGLCFDCDNVEYIENYYDEWREGEEDYRTETLNPNKLYEKAGLSFEEMDKYLQGDYGYAIHITKLEIFDKPKDISEFKRCTEKVCIYSECHKYMHCLKSLTRAPQSWQYIEV